MPATYEPIATTTLGSAASEINFTSITSSYTDLRLVIVHFCTTGGNMQLRFNSDSGTNYSTTFLNGNGSAASSARYTNQTKIDIGAYFGVNSASNANFITVDIFSYAGSTNKTTLSESSNDQNGSGSVGRHVGLWRNTAAITAIKLIDSTGGNLNSGTTATLYGIKAA